MQRGRACRRSLDILANGARWLLGLIKMAVADHPGMRYIGSFTDAAELARLFGFVHSAGRWISTKPARSAIGCCEACSTGRPRYGRYGMLATNSTILDCAWIWQSDSRTAARPKG
jgi:hypothetical protein